MFPLLRRASIFTHFADWKSLQEIMSLRCEAVQLDTVLAGMVLFLQKTISASERLQRLTTFDFFLEALNIGFALCQGSPSTLLCLVIINLRPDLTSTQLRLQLLFPILVTSIITVNRMKTGVRSNLLMAMMTTVSLQNHQIALISFPLVAYVIASRKQIRYLK